MKTLSNNGLQLIKSFEGCYLTAYDDLQPKVKITHQSQLKGTLTIGWGSTKNVKIGQTITQKEADERLVAEIQSYIAATNNKANVPFINQLNQNQFDALVSFCYNCGAGNLKRLCSSGLGKVPTNILLYNKSKGIVLKGLERRRAAERDLFIKAPSNKDLLQTSEQSVIEAIQQKIKDLEKQVGLFDVADSPDIDPPSWILKEFPEILKYTKKEKLPYDVWHSILITLRYVDVTFLKKK